MDKEAIKELNDRMQRVEQKSAADVKDANDRMQQVRMRVAQLDAMFNTMQKKLSGG